MARKNYTPEQILIKLREAEVMQSKGQSIAVACRQIGVTETTYYKWRKEYGGLRLDQAKRFKQMEQENQRLKKVIAELTIDNAILKEAARGNF